MAVGASELTQLHPVSGVRLSAVAAGIRYPNRLDLVVIALAEGSVVSGVFTQNAFCAAPVTIAKAHLSSGVAPRYLLINTGNANAGTGKRGLDDAKHSCASLAAICDVPTEAVIPFSTGVIGEHLPMLPIIANLTGAFAFLEADQWLPAAKGIMTTDTRPKGASDQFKFEGKTITVTGICKGSGMIHPNMATMLSFVATDAPVSQAMLDKLLHESTETSFNRITVDGDTSTNDASILIASGTADVSLCDSESSPLYAPLKACIDRLMIQLAHSIVRDGEGATKFVAIKVKEAANAAEARSVGFTVAHSPLVKTALSASDANWGRILAAIGRADVQDLDVNRVTIHINGILIVEDGARAASYTEIQGAVAMQSEHIAIDINLARGSVSDTVYTTDFSEEYVRINADYRS